MQKVKKVKRVEFNSLKAGQFFTLGKQIYQVDETGDSAQQLTGHDAGRVFDELFNVNGKESALVTPIKVKITRVE